MKRNKLSLLIAAVIVSSGFTTQTLLAAESEAAVEEENATILVIGTRSRKVRSISDSTVPVDIISSEDMQAMGNTFDLTDNLKTLIPSYTAVPLTGDASAFVRPTSLRGTASDQTLVLVNGKRRHRSALVHFLAPAAGNGAHGVDIGMIPSIAIQRVEVLRDGAASQYGSDAIAGVINFVMKDADSGGQAQFQLGQHYEGENSVKFAFNKGMKLSDDSFVNFSLDYNDNDALSRGHQQAECQTLIDAGIIGCGTDSPFNDAPLAQTWGRSESSALRLFINSGADLSNGKKLYARVGYADTEGRYRFFFREPPNEALGLGGDSHITPLVALGLEGGVADHGFTPFFDGLQTDLTIVVGVEGETSNGTYYDFSFGIGENILDYTLNNTINSSLGLTPALTIPQRDFYVGGYEQYEINFNADFSQLLTESINFAYGFEFREETFTINAGEPNAYFGRGSSGFAGHSPATAGENSRTNTAIYGDVEHDISSDLLMQYALRYENYSDFGGTTNAKVAFRYTLTETMNLRGSVSTGFHAPTPGQSNVTTVITTADAASNELVEEGLLPTSSPTAILYGAKPLTEETSVNMSIGITADIGESTTLTVDAYTIEVEDRIYRTTNIQTPNGLISFFTNAMTIKHSGLDVVLTSQIEWSADLVTDVAFSYAYNEIEFVSQQMINGVFPVSADSIEDIENNWPKNRFSVTTNTQLSDDWSMMIRGNYYGEHYDERGTIGGSSPSSLISPTFFVDIEVGYQVAEQFRLSFGLMNAFDEYPDKMVAPNANRTSQGHPYPRRTPANFEGGSYYLSGTYTFD